MSSHDTTVILDELEPYSIVECEGEAWVKLPISRQWSSLRLGVLTAQELIKRGPIRLVWQERPL